MNHRTRIGRSLCVLGTTLVVGGLSLSMSTSAGAAASPEPTYGSATVDGSAGEWAPSDQWGTIVTNDPPHRVVASASLRYDCASGVLFVLVAAAPGEIFQTIDPEEAYVRLGTQRKLVSGLSGNDGTAPDFSWVGQSGDTATGFEASAVIAPGAYPASLRIHGKLPDDSADGYETIDLQPRYHDLTITCVEAATTTTTFPPTTVAPTTAAPTTTSTTSTTQPAKVLSTTSTTAKPVDPPTDPATPAPVVLAKKSDPATVQVKELARTGAPTGQLTALGTVLLLAGWALVQRSRTARNAT